MDVESFKRACRNLGSPTSHADAERLLLSLRTSPQGVDIALEVLSDKENEDLIVYHAALLLRDTSLRQYQAGGVDRAIFLMKRCVDDALERKPHGSTDTLLQSSAALYKRVFLDCDKYTRSELVQRVSQILMQDSTHEWHAIRLLLHVIWEFSLHSKSTSLGQSLEFHYKCGQLFSKLFLTDLFLLSAGYLTRVHSLEVCLSLLDLIETMLSWPFEKYFQEELEANNNRSDISESRNVPLDYRSGTHQLRNSSRIITPPPQWFFLIQRGELIHKLMVLYRGVQQQPITYTHQEEMLSKIRQLIVSLACLSGPIFDHNDEIKLQHCQLISEVGYSFCQHAFQNIQLLKESINLSVHDSPLGSEILDGCVIISRIFSITPAELCLRDDSRFQNLLRLTQAVSEACRMCTVSYEKSFLGESLSSLLSVWVLWISFVSSSPQNSLPQTVVLTLSKSSFSLFENLILTKLITAQSSKESCEEEHDEEAEYEEMSDLATIARVNPEPSLSSLATRLRSFDSQNARDSTDIKWERLSFLVALTANILADPDDGETPMIPRAILQYSQTVSKENDDVVINCSLALFETFERETNRLHLVSPFLSETIMHAMKRWTSTYLYPPAYLYSNPESRFRFGDFANLPDRYPSKLHWFALYSNVIASIS